MHRALISGVAIAILCSVIGLFLVLRRYSLFGDAIAHSSFGGIALGLLAGVYPLWTAYGVSLVSALIITRVKEKFNISGDASVAVLLSSGIAVGLVIIGISGGFTIDIFSFLFGSILLVSVNDTILILSLTGIILIVVLVLYRQLLYSTFNEEQAKVSGIPVEKINYLIVFMAGLTVVTSIQLVGVLLISALFVIPNVTAIMYGKGFKQTAILSISFSIFSVVTGILISYVFDITPAGTIVLLSIGLFAGTMGIKSMGLLSKN
ncbi:MAG: metal ABC transporter permease [Nitrosopumilaceae archaeon]|jgi:zinc transport system permease protein|uniref:Metal ABC transporter permease n=2 Tax=Candidatus Nitrosomaritimum aestuariumsis TaxID=3342354 RepID=A0AC60W708_9ARCH|nr:metal ABC transporter permease [Nitrosopumilaceae archaeon]MBA4460466.1 metal ABC transporter permease [Nitrosopumilaceae archaeon]MBA4461264.1 metal ABC transporter permease [Nitrosopumilaceae archaeon]MBA4462929.1 metal ABC transporter permease [Nitrosopumilaceae archaeon]NCF21389.1 iron chelate uptake ABC transporter family permease subunit [Nitrosopumilaceae archaeon]